MPILDGHMHLWERVAAWRGRAQTPARSLGRVSFAGKTMDMLPPAFADSTSPAHVAVAYMDRAGVDRAILVQEVLDGFLNEVVAAAVTAYPDRFIGEAMVDPRDGEASRGALETCLATGPFRGMKIPLPAFEGLVPDFRIDGALAQGWFDTCARHRAFVTIHPTMPARFAEPMRTVAERHGDIDFIIAHLGFPHEAGWEQTLALGHLPNVYFELAAVPLYFGDPFPCPRARAAIETAARTIGAHKILWGSDYPRTLNDLTYTQQLDVVRHSCTNLAREEKEMILGGTAATILEGTWPPS